MAPRDGLSGAPGATVGRGRRLRSAVAEVNRTVRPETDRTLRGLILATVCLAVVSVMAAGAAPLGECVLILVLLPTGFWWSDSQRERSNFVAKGIISVLAMVVLYRFFMGLRGIGSVDDARLPLTLMFLEIQVLHGFDLPQRRDLMFTLASSLALTGLAVASGPSTWLLVVIALYLVLAGASLQRYRRSVDTEWIDGATVTATPHALPDRPATTGSVRRGPLGYAAAVVVLAALVFASVPLRSDASLGGLPISFGISGPQQADGSSRVNGDLPFDDADGDGSRETDPLEYFGFAERVDPRQVAELSDTPILQVRTNRPRPLRGVVFDVYDDGVWGRSEDTPDSLQGLPIQLPAQRSGRVPTERVTQTISLLRSTPNLLFAAADPVEVWTAARSATPWLDGTLTTSIDMDEGAIYSIISEVDVTPFAQLAAMPLDRSAIDDQAYARWTTLPDTVPDRVHDLAAQLAADAPADTPFAIAATMQTWIGANVGYSLEVDPTPQHADPADHILFESQLGWCEPIATAMVVMLRSQGIPSRFVTGFQPGERSILNGQHTIRASDAHAWVEVLIPGHGWITFDPTGATTPTLDPEGEGPQILLLDLFAWIGERLPRDPLFWITALVVSGAAMAAVTTARRRREAARLVAAGPWAGLLALLRDEGVDPPASATPAEVVDVAARQLPTLSPDALTQLRTYEETRRYTTDEVDRTPADAALQVLADR